MPPVDLARYLLHAYGAGSPGGVTALKLQKLVYYVKAWSLVAGRDLVAGHVEAWPYGPVQPAVYRAYSPHGANPLPLPSDAPVPDPDARELIERDGVLPADVGR